MMYKENYKIKEFGKEVVLNIETVGKSCPMGRYYFHCKECKNQSISDDEGTCYSCNNFIDVWNDDENKVYCKNYVKEVNNGK